MDDTQSKATTKRISKGPQQGPHWSPLHEIDARESGRQAQDSLEELLSEVVVSNVPLGMRADILSSGMNVALNRWPKIEVISQVMAKSSGVMPTWKPTRQKVLTFGLQFPEGASLIASQSATAKKEQPAPGEVLQSPAPPIEVLPDYEPPTVASLLEEVPDLNKEKKVTRIKPPDDALLIEDRLFYLLQPPLQSWLAGQEMVMPFEPFSYQYEGIGWLFSNSSALLADEMGLGKTMQTITAIRLLVRSGQVRRVLLICPKPLLPNWQREFQTWAEELPFVVVEGDGDRRKLTWTMPGVPVLIANYESMVRDFAAFPEGEFPSLI